jgi:hypothetical protein
MKPLADMSAIRRRSGSMLIECLVYIAVFGILLGLGTAALFFCWDHTRAVVFTTDQVESALRAGETWRADVRSATGPITVETTPEGGTMAIPFRSTEILYHLANGELRRELKPSGQSRPLLAKVKSSQMQTEPRAGVTAWRWELELTPRRQETHFPLLFTFEAAQPKP